MPRAPNQTTASPASVARRLAHVPNAFSGAVAAMADPVRARVVAEANLRIATHCPEVAISSFLDSPYGGAFGIDVAQRVAAGDSTEAAVAVVVREWMTHPPTAAEEAALAIPPGLPYLTAIVTAAGMAQA